MLKEEYWQGILNRDRSLNNVILYAVISTKIYCLPSCPSRKPKKANVLIFNTCLAAEKAGFRPCKRCLPRQNAPEKTRIELIAQICRAITVKIEERLTIKQLSIQFNYSPSYLQRIFKLVVGITPKQYLEIFRLTEFKLELQKQTNISEAIYQAGYQSSSSLYDNISSKLGMTPKTYQQKGKATKIVYSIVSSHLGYLLVATTDKGICAVKIGDRQELLVTQLTQEFSQATIIHDNKNHQDWIYKIVSLIKGEPADSDLPLDIRGTVFQHQVWQALQKIPFGETRTYQEIANYIEQPKATRAIGSACGANPVALIIPCHRVIRSDGCLGGYRWGIERKRQLIAEEHCRKND